MVCFLLVLLPLVNFTLQTCPSSETIIQIVTPLLQEFGAPKRRLLDSIDVQATLQVQIPEASI
jgi:hypothetical protein